MSWTSNIYKVFTLIHTLCDSNSANEAIMADNTIFIKPFNHLFDLHHQKISGSSILYVFLLLAASSLFLLCDQSKLLFVLLA